jgi:hypothetical protein
LGTLWSALAKCLAPRHLASVERSDAKEPSKRDRWLVKKEGFIDSRYMQVSSSPPQPAVPIDQKANSDTPPRSFQQPFEPDSEGDSGVGEDEHKNRTKPEIITANLAGAFIRYVLNFCAEQNPVKGIMLEFQEEPYHIYDNLPGLDVSATDDGGIWVVATEEQGKLPWKCKERLVFLEAKRAFQRIGDDNKPIVSSSHLAQYTCEALTQHLKYLGQKEYIYPLLLYPIPTADIYARVFAIVMTQTFMRFLHFDFSEEYKAYLGCKDPEEQRVLKAYLCVTETDFFDLKSKKGRGYAVRNLLGLVKFWEEQKTTRVEGKEEKLENEYTVDELGTKVDGNVGSGDPKRGFEETSDLDDEDYDLPVMVTKKKRRNF